MVVEIDGAPHMIEQIQVQTPSARGAATLYKIKARNLKTKKRVEKVVPRHRWPERVELRAPAGPVSSTATRKASTSWTRRLQPVLAARRRPGRPGPVHDREHGGRRALVVDDEVIAIEMPDTVELPIVETAPGVRGNSATGRTKPATLSTGLRRPGPRAPGPGGRRCGSTPDRRVPRPRELKMGGVTWARRRDGWQPHESPRAAPDCFRRRRHSAINRGRAGFWIRHIRAVRQPLYLIKNGSSIERLQAVADLGLLKEDTDIDRVTAALVSAMDDGEIVLRSAAEESLGSLLAQSLSRPDPGTTADREKDSRRVALALRKLTMGLSDPERSIRASAAVGLGFIGKPGDGRSAPELALALADESPIVPHRRR